MPMRKIDGIVMLTLILVLTFTLVGCTPHINQVKRKWSSPAKVEDRGDTGVSYYYFPPRGNWAVVELTTDREGKIQKQGEILETI